MLRVAAVSRTNTTSPPTQQVPIKPINGLPSPPGTFAESGVCMVGGAGPPCSGMGYIMVRAHHAPPTLKAVREICQRWASPGRGFQRAVPASNQCKTPCVIPPSASHQLPGRQRAKPAQLGCLGCKVLPNKLSTRLGHGAAPLEPITRVSGLCQPSGSHPRPWWPWELFRFCFESEGNFVPGN